MLPTGKLGRLAAGLTGVTTILVLSVVALAAPAAAAPVPNGMFTFAGTLTPPTTVTSQYSCDLTGYGAGIKPATLSSTLTIPASVVADSNFDIKLATTASDSLPPAVVTALNGVTSFDIATSVDVSQSLRGIKVFDENAQLTGTVTAPSSITVLPVLTATGSAAFPLSGIGTVKAPAATVTITPQKGTTALAPINCTTTATSQDEQVTVIPETIGTQGPLYTCIWGIPGVQINKQFVHVPATITTSGSATTGKKITVTYQTTTFGAETWSGAGATSVTYAGSLPVIGAQPGKVVLDQAVDLNAPSLKLSGKLSLTKAGTDRIEVPQKFTFTLTIPTSRGSVLETLGCTLTTKPTPIGRTIKVKKAPVRPHPHPTHSSSPTPSQGVQGSGTPTGAPNTGGGLGGPGGGLGLAIAGLGIAGAGGGLMMRGRFLRRRRTS